MNRNENLIRELHNFSNISFNGEREGYKNLSEEACQSVTVEDERNLSGKIADSLDCKHRNGRLIVVCSPS